MVTVAWWELIVWIIGPALFTFALGRFLGVRSVMAAARKFAQAALDVERARVDKLAKQVEFLEGLFRQHKES